MRLIQSTLICAAVLVATSGFAEDGKADPKAGKPGSQQATAASESTINLTVTGMT